MQFIVFLYVRSEHYFDTHNSDLRIQQSAILALDNSGLYLDVFIAFYKEDVKTLINLKKDNAIDPAIDRQKSIEEGLKGLYQITIDDKPITETDWFFTETGLFKQKGFICRIKLYKLTQGLHHLSINKIVVNEEDHHEWLKSWDALVFYYQTQS
ncbi:MAG: hypothetical protein HRT35_03945 [Algicola sp.]|nr:hypothetical protein [Algicola sp.]